MTSELYSVIASDIGVQIVFDGRFPPFENMDVARKLIAKVNEVLPEYFTLCLMRRKLDMLKEAVAAQDEKERELQAASAVLDLMIKASNV